MIEAELGKIDKERSEEVVRHRERMGVLSETKARFQSLLEAADGSDEDDGNDDSKTDAFA